MTRCRPIALLVGLCLAGLAAEKPAGSRFAFVESDTRAARATLDPSNVSPYRVHPHLFGKFTEVLGHNVYQGFWAQILANPSLEPISRCLKDEAKNTAMDLPFAWHRWNGADTTYALVPDAFNSGFAQLLTVRSLPGGKPAAGIRQAAHLPIHRQLRYEFSVYVKDLTTPLLASVCLADHPDDVLAQVELPAPAGDGWHKLAATLDLKAQPDWLDPPRRLWVCLGLAKPGHGLLDQAMLWPADQTQGFDPDVVKALREYPVTILRFPGGNYVSGYHWKDDLTELDKRPTKPNPAWNTCDPHHVGTDEHMQLCRLINAEPMICVNVGNGTPQEAADWVEYCNGGPETRWGAVRAARGHPKPYNVRVWEIGNEIWGGWQIGHCNAEEYARRYLAFRKAMLAVDPNLHLIACGFQDWGEPGWNQVLFDRCGDTVESMSLHLLFSNGASTSPLSSYLCQMGYSHHFEAFFRNLDARARRRDLSPRFAITELMEIGRGLPYQVSPNTLSEALFFAGTLNSAIRTEGMVEIITYSAVVNHGGGLSKQSGRVFWKPSARARHMLRVLIGGNPVGCRVTSPFEDVPEWQTSWAGPDRHRFPLMDVLPVLHQDRLDIVVLNRDPTEVIPLEIDLGGIAVGNELRVTTVTGDSFMAANDLRHPERVVPVTETRRLPPASRVVRIEPHPVSVSVLSLDRK